MAHPDRRLAGKHGLEAVLIGNAAAALQGAPVTTVDFDFLFRKTPANIRKLKAITAELDAVLLRPLYPVSDLFRIARDGDGMQIDFMGTIHGIRSFASLRSRAHRVPIGGREVLVADLADIIKSKKSAGRPQDVAVLPTLERVHHEKANLKKDEAGGTPERE